MKLHILASGSKGNASLIEDERTGSLIAIDCGICKREFLSRCAQSGIDVSRIEGMLITHEHTDHTKGIGVLMRGLAKQGISMPIYASAAVCRASADIAAVASLCDTTVFNVHESLTFSRFEVTPFHTSHDAAESFGFRIEGTSGDVIGYMTDTGVLTQDAASNLVDCRTLAIESNHDAAMLKNGPYPFALKKRVASDTGHLSNTQAHDALAGLLSGTLEHVVAMHVSENNNTYRLARNALAEALDEAGHPAIAHVAYQHQAISI